MQNIDRKKRYESRLEKYREKTGLTREEIVKDLVFFGIKITYVAYCKWEAGERCPSLHTCNNLRTYFKGKGVEVGDLIDLFPIRHF